MHITWQYMKEYLIVFQKTDYTHSYKLVSESNVALM